MKPADLIGGHWVELASAGQLLVQSRNPARPEDVVWRGAAELTHVERAVEAARLAQQAWSERTVQERAEVLQRFARGAAAAVPELAALITREVGKTLAESTQEAQLVADKVAITLDPISAGRVTDYQVDVGPTRTGHCVFRPLGVVAVVGPFNFPAHLPNGHIIPALLLGNTVVFKPSEQAPAVAQRLAMLYSEFFPPGVVNVVNGPGEVAAALTAHPEIDGVLFTGSWAVGRRILHANLDRPGRMLALEMGGSNAAVVMDDAHLPQAIIECARSAFATTGQRCTCTRRIIVHEMIAEKFIAGLCGAARSLATGPGDSKEPTFMGPLVSDAARAAALAFQESAMVNGARVHLAAAPLAPAAAPNGWFLSAGVLEVDRFELDRDREVFAPIVQIARATDLADAIVQANATEFGLAAAIFTQSAESYRRFLRSCRAGCINWNTGTAGASSKLPFGGLGKSGNLRPAAAFSVDYCATPVASMIERSDAAPVPMGMRGP